MGAAAGPSTRNPGIGLLPNQRPSVAAQPAASSIVSLWTMTLASTATGG